MKYIISIIIIALLNMSTIAQNNNITNTLGMGGVFSIRDASSTYFSLSQSTGQVNINRNLGLPNTESSSVGVITKNGISFLHSYGVCNTFLGYWSGNFTLTGSNNNAVGFYSLKCNTTGSQNCAFGGWSLFANTTGYNNSAFGSSALGENVTGYHNSAFGNTALLYNQIGSYNSAFGVDALINSNADGNSAFGKSSLYSNTGGFYNTAFGYNSLYSNSSGFYNTAFGMSALSSNTSGNNNIGLGWDAQLPNGTANNQVRVGNSFISYAGIQVAWTITSDRKWKDNIMPSPLGLSFISRLNPVSYIRKNDESKKTEYGLIAQEVEQVLKDDGIDNAGMITVSDSGDYELRYNDLIAPMIKAIQELNEENEKLKIKNEELEERLAKVEELQSTLVKDIENLKEVQFKEIKSVQK